jgi:hypothetical protein
MDADVIPCMNFELLFDDFHYTKNSHLFFCDIFSYGKYKNSFSDSTYNLFNFFGISLKHGEPETDSGLFVLNKQILTDRFIHVNLFLNLHHEIIYKHVYGDKELYNLSMRICNIEFTTNNMFPKIIGKYFENQNIFCGNGVIFTSMHTNMVPYKVCVHMTLHSVDHIELYDNIWKKSLWTHFFDKEIPAQLINIRPVNQAICPIYSYDMVFMIPVDSALKNIQEKMYFLYFNGLKSLFYEMNNDSIT